MRSYLNYPTQSLPLGKIERTPLLQCTNAILMWKMLLVSVVEEEEGDDFDDIDLEETVEQPEEPMDNDTHEHAIINRSALVDLLVSTFKCLRCNGSITSNSIKFVDRGCASSINFFCSHCTVVASAKSSKVHTRLSKKITNRTERTEEPSDLALTDYELNRKMVLAFQRFGQAKAGEAARSMCAMLGLPIRGLATHWTKVEEVLALDEVIVGEDIIEENLQAEIKLSPVCRWSRRTLLSICQDMGWPKKGSGNLYNSLAGHHVVIGNLTRAIIFLHCYSKTCAKCDRKKSTCTDTNFCAKNYAGKSSKGMEVQGTKDSFWHF
jgi:hypothetical protein